MRVYIHKYANVAVLVLSHLWCIKQRRIFACQGHETLLCQTILKAVLAGENGRSLTSFFINFQPRFFVIGDYLAVDYRVESVTAVYFDSIQCCNIMMFGPCDQLLEKIKIWKLLFTYKCINYSQTCSKDHLYIKTTCL